MTEVKKHVHEPMPMYVTLIRPYDVPFFVTLVACRKDDCEEEEYAITEAHEIR